MTWLVRLGTERGKGEYVCATTRFHDMVFVVAKQSGARRFEWRPLAEDYARDYGGRVVKLKRKR